MQALNLISTASLTRDEWLESRRKGIGGSDAAAIVGLDRYRSPWDVWADKSGLPTDSEENEAMRLGRDLETYVAERFSGETGLGVARVNRILQSPEHPFMLANIDRRIIGMGGVGLECKTTSALNPSKFAKGEYPDNYYVQCMHYMAVTGAPCWYLAVLVLGKGFHVYQIERDEGDIAALIEAEAAFWNNHVIAESPPPTDGSRTTSAILERMYPRSAGNVVPLNGLEEHAAEYLRIGAEIKALERQQEAHRQALIQEIGDADEGRLDGYKVTYKNRSGADRVDKNMLREGWPEAYAACAAPGKNSRAFIVKKLKEDDPE